MEILEATSVGSEPRQLIFIRSYFCWLIIELDGFCTQFFRFMGDRKGYIAGRKAEKTN